MKSPYPPLPEPLVMEAGYDHFAPEAFTAVQVRAYGEACYRLAVEDLVGTVEGPLYEAGVMSFLNNFGEEMYRQAILDAAEAVDPAPLAPNSTAYEAEVFMALQKRAAAVRKLTKEVEAP